MVEIGPRQPVELEGRVRAPRRVRPLLAVHVADVFRPEEQQQVDAGHDALAHHRPELVVLFSASPVQPIERVLACVPP